MIAVDDADWMAATARLAARTYPLCRPNPGVAAILVKDGRVIARGITQATGRPHAEAEALKGLGEGGAKGTTLYVTLEPCAHKSERGPACSDIVIAARPDRVVIGQLDPDKRTTRIGVKRIEAAGIDVTVLDDEHSRASLKGYLTREKLGRPYVTLKLAMSLDGCIALPDGSSQWITGDAARAHVHAHRARQDHILVGGGTWRADKPRLDVRLPGLVDRSPDRVLLTRGIAPDGARVINEPAQISSLEGAQTLYVEGGAVAAASFLAEDLVDELHLYRAPILIGSGQSALGDLGLENLADAHDRWQLSDTRQLGSDTFTSYVRVRN
ncbi:bifunctional diaminohydroxyphosphoribosylaminopyrimidine deaminase/5-amino-6-(5-phosphoribosylamino)uracil reductase RibD [uncultured Erythrobacter sp.]|uniref:bifunctional diaminohydroxyphosphoribosylaminopyrimidine deaminase/5-amino-6-(5-phosphoribosylamino)uracil reductase RibD n=1 Tax=uncultured Erythrobacter sp. TaxID=263913 RepID=UPI002618AAB2|nr:bifunctional diaminohydroxyphosphoribosylaminopyrimidine deaminase/5-amino-6-(5-phosphoribosylamino)uracil reductase RibD [uncultured Erythrobacter sp.]